jgi:tetratricopeptide (TPR) repeat protein
MGKIIKLPAQASRLGYRRVRRRCRKADAPNQLDLFAAAEARAQILEFKPDLGPFEQALWWDERGDERAAELYARAIEQEDSVADALCNLGILISRDGDPIKAFDCFSRCLARNPRHLEAHYNLANLYFEMDDFRLARAHYRMAVEIDEEFANAHYNLALAEALLGDMEGAERALRKYQRLVTEEEGRAAEEVLNDLRRNAPADARVSW